jgi:hypothetical protein
MKLELSPDGYERIEEKIQTIADLANKGIFDPNAARRRLQDVCGGLRELRHILHEVCLVVPDAADPSGSGAA